MCCARLPSNDKDHFNIFRPRGLAATFSYLQPRLPPTYKTPNMTSPVSIGDALLLAKIAWRLGKAFTKGRKSSISEFREVESQLYALSTALSALHNSGLTQNGDDSNALSSMLENCRGTLSHLQAIVDQYGSLGETRDDTGVPVFKRWSSRLQRDWRAIKWTTEGGDLAKMRSELMVHINSLNLFMSVTSKCVSTIQVQPSEPGKVLTGTLLQSPIFQNQRSVGRTDGHDETYTPFARRESSA